MANKICRITILKFMHPEWNHQLGIGYDIWDLENGIQYCQEYIELGFTNETMDGFNLKDYIEWAKKEIITISLCEKVGG